jgi:ribosomal protein S27AE
MQNDATRYKSQDKKAGREIGDDYVTVEFIQGLHRVSRKCVRCGLPTSFDKHDKRKTTWFEV